MASGLFLGIGLWFGWAGRCTWRAFAGLALLAAMLEVVQWRLGHFERVEWADIVANEAGLVLAWWVLAWRTRAVG